MEKYKSYGAFSKTTHFLRLFCVAGVVRQCIKGQAGVVQDGLSGKYLLHLATHVDCQAIYSCLIKLSPLHEHYLSALSDL